MSGMLCLYFMMWLHPFYISMTDIKYNAPAKSIEVSVRIFTDDFEKILRKNCGCKVDLSSKEKMAIMAPLVQQYILRHLKMKVNGHDATLAYKGYQAEEESTWSYFEISNIKSFAQMNITNTLLHDYNEGQINMLHITANGKEQSDKLDYPQNVLEVKF